MPLFTAIGATVIGATALAAGAAAAGGFFSSLNIKDRIQDGGRSVDTGQLSEAEAQTQAKKRAFRSGVIFTTPAGLGEEARTTGAKLR